MTAAAPELLGYLSFPCPKDPKTTHLTPVHISGSPGKITSKMAIGPDTPTTWCPHCRGDAPWSTTHLAQ
jgi:hypothetical protein